MKKTIKETAIPNEILIRATKANYHWDPDNGPLLYVILFKAITQYLAMYKNKNNDEVLKVTDLKGNLIFAGIVGYTENENPDMPGNWSYEFVFDDADIPVSETGIHTSMDPTFIKILAQTGLSDYNATFHNETVMCDMYIIAAQVLRTALFAQQVEEEPIEIGIDGYFSAKVELVNGEKVVTMTPDGSMKKIIKDDYSIQIS